MSEPEAAEEVALRERLRALRVDPPEGDFARTLHQRLVAAGPPEAAPTLGERLRGLLGRRAPVLWPLAGALAGVAAFWVMTALQPVTVGRGGDGVVAQAVQSPGTVVPSSKVAVVKLDFSVDVAVEQADFQVSLPDGLSFWADGEELPQRSFEWTQPLTAGSNLIPIAVRGHAPGSYRLTVTARAGGQMIEHDVVLKVTDG